MWRAYLILLRNTFSKVSALVYFQYKVSVEST